MKTTTIDVIHPDEINLNTLSSLINNANIECGIDQEEIYILNHYDYPVYLQIDSEIHGIYFNCYLGIKKDASLNELALFVKKLNDEITYCNFNFNKSENGRIQIGGSSIYSYYYGVHIDSLLYQIQMFIDRFVAGCFEDESGSFVIYDDEGHIMNINTISELK